MTELHELHRIPESAHYVCGFVFNTTLSDVLLIRKLRPDWQAGRLNGIGGRIDPGEDPRTAMSRECRQECGLAIDPQDWHPLAAVYKAERFLVHFYHVATPEIGEARSLTEEQVQRRKVADLMLLDTVRHVRWLICLAVDPFVAAKIVVEERTCTAQRSGA